MWIEWKWVVRWKLNEAEFSVEDGIKKKPFKRDLGEDRFFFYGELSDDRPFLTKK